MLMVQVAFEKTKGVLLRQDITWRHNVDVSALSYFHLR